MTTREGLSRALLIVTALAGWTGIILQLLVSARHGTAAGLAPWRALLPVLGYFTILTNLLIAVLVSTRLARASARHLLSRPGTLAAAAVYILVVGLIYSLLLRQLWAPTGMQKAADLLLHDLVPVLYVSWWLLFAPKGGLDWGAPLRWLLYPLAYFVFSLLLGQATGRYLYPFADVGVLGLTKVLRNGLLLLVLFWVLGLAAVALSRLGGNRGAAG